MKISLYTTGYCFLFLLACITSSNGQVTNSTKSKTSTNDTLTLEIAVPQNSIPFEPHESDYRSGIIAAKSSTERSRVLKKYFDALYSSSLTEEQKKTLLANKVIHLTTIDFYSLHLSFGLVAKEQTNAKPLLFATVLRKTVSSDQMSAITEYQKYAVASAKLMVYNQTTGETTQLQKPAGWPDGLPLPGYGWGKYTSSDDVATPVSMQYHLNAEERYALISGYIRDGKKVSQDDLAWHKLYEVNNTAPKPGTKTNQTVAIKKTNEQLLNELIGQHFKYEAISYFDCTTCKVTGYKSINEIMLRCKYGNSRKATYDELVKNNNKFGYHPATAVLSKCKTCNGKGVVRSSFSHTNDYEYTLGKKITYKSSSIVKCHRCDGSGYDDGY